MYKVIISWYGKVAILEGESDFYLSLKRFFPLEDKTKEEVEEKVYNILDNLSWNHYGLFSQQTEIIHKIIE